MASRNDEKRHNDEFVALYHKSGMTQRAIAEAIGVSLITVKTWCVAEGADMARDCPKWRVDAFKIFLGLKLKDLTPKQREEVMDILRGI
jgi:DNA-binding XRE family transcriptional regulator